MPRRGVCLLLGLQVLCVWPVWAWLAGRLTSPEHALCTLLAIGGVVLLLARGQGRGGAPQPHHLWFATLLMLIYVVLVHVTQVPVAAVFAVFCTVLLSGLLCGTLSPPFAAWGIATLLVPTVPVLQCFIGYPMRVLTTRMAAFMLACTGLPVRARGAGITLGAQTIWVDAPCSGVRMMWVLGFVCLLLCGLRRLRWPATLLACVVAGIVVLGANALRAASLFYGEADLLPDVVGSWHSAIGVVVFAAAVAAQIGVIEWLGHRQNG